MILNTPFIVGVLCALNCCQLICIVRETRPWHKLSLTNHRKFSTLSL